MDIGLLLEALVVILLVVLNVYLRKMPGQNGRAVDSVIRVFEERDKKREQRRAGDIGGTALPVDPPVDPSPLTSFENLPQDVRMKTVNDYVRKLTGGV